MFDSIKKFFARRAIKKAIKFLNKYEDFILQFIPNANIRKLIDTLTDFLGELSE
jgi:hypothetical protein